MLYIGRYYFLSQFFNVYESLANGLRSHDNYVVYVRELFLEFLYFLFLGFFEVPTRTLI